jgi:ABC-type multidrug transport system permease subunit
MDIKGSPLKYLGLLGFLGLLGLFTDNPGFYGFFGGFAFFGFANIKNDERYSLNLAKAGLNAWAVTFVGLALTIAYTGVTRAAESALWGLMLVYPVSVLTFVSSFAKYDR